MLLSSHLQEVRERKNQIKSNFTHVVNRRAKGISWWRKKKLFISYKSWTPSAHHRLMLEMKWRRDEKKCWTWKYSVFAMSSWQFFSDSIIVIPEHGSSETINRRNLFSSLVLSREYLNAYFLVLECRSLCCNIDVDKSLALSSLFP